MGRRDDPKGQTMTMTNTQPLRRILLADAAVGKGAGLVVTLGAGFLAPLLALPQGLLFWAGMALFPFAALLVALALRPTFPRMMLIDVVAINALWSLGSVALLLSGAVSPNALGAAFVLAQAALVGLFALLQAGHLRREDRPATA
jgi:hypothetical protein